MDFNDSKPIYRQIMDYAYERILTGAWRAGERIPSVRELTSRLEVNARTVLKAMDSLQDEGIVTTRRGMGFTLAEDAHDRVRAARRQEFFATSLPAFAAEMQLLCITPEEAMEAMKNRKWHK